MYKSTYLIMIGTQTAVDIAWLSEDISPISTLNDYLLSVLLLGGADIVAHMD